MDKFKAVVVRKDGEEVVYDIEEISLDNLDEGSVIVEVHYSSMNYKDMLGMQLNGGVINTYPMIPGIDLSGVVYESNDPNYVKGQKVMVNGTDSGVSHTGGYAEFARMPAEWLIPMPEELSLKDAMLIGTAGFTSGQAIDALEKHGMHPDNNPRVLVTGASGGVGSIALAILNKIGYRNVTAMVRKDYQEELVTKLGANHILWADDVGEKRMLASQKYDYILDTVGGEVAASLIPQIQATGSIALCGNAGGADLETNVYPFILRGINILGINGIFISPEYRQALWNKLATDWDVIDQLRSRTVDLEDIAQTVEDIKKGAHLGRTIIKVK